MSAHVNASSIIVRDQIVSQGALYVNGSMTMGNGSSIMVRGGPTLTFDARGVNIGKHVVLGAGGIHINSDIGLSLSTREHVVHHISRDMSQASEIDDDHIPTTRAIREYIDAQGVGARFSCLTVGELRAHGDRPISVDSPIVFRDTVTIGGPVLMGYAHLRDNDALIDCNKYSLFFVDGASCAKVVNPSCAREFTYVMQIINISHSVSVVIDFGCGCANVGAGRAAKFAYMAPVERWICVTEPDIFYPTRIDTLSCAFRADSCVVSADGRIAIAGTPRDGANGGARVLIHRASDNKWICAQVCEDGRQSRAYGRITMRPSSPSTCAQQGRVCAINGDGTMIAIASEFSIWLLEMAIISRADTGALVSVRNLTTAHEPLVTYQGERIEYMAFDDARRLRAVVATERGNEARIVCDDSTAQDGQHCSHDALDAFVPDARVAMSANGQTHVDARGCDSAQCESSKAKCAGAIEHAHHTIIVKRDPRTGKLIIIIDLPHPAKTVTLCASGAHGLVCMENGTLAHIY